MGYGSRVVELLYRYYNGEIVDLHQEQGVFSDNDSGKETDESDQEENAFEGNGIRIEKLKPRKKLPPLLLPLTEVKAPRLDWIGTSFGLTGDLFRFWKRAGMSLLYLRQTKNELTAEHSSIMIRSLPQRSGFDDAWLPAFSADARRRIISLLSGPFRALEVKVATAVLTDLSNTTLKSTTGVRQGTSSTVQIRSGMSSALEAEELNYWITPHDLKRLELYGRNLCDHHLITDLLPPLSRLFFTERFGDSFSLSSLQALLLCGMGLQNKTVDEIVNEIRLPANQVLAMFNKAIRKISINLRSVVEQDEKSKLLSDSAVAKAERRIEGMKQVTQQTLEEDTREGSNEALSTLHSQERNISGGILLDAELVKYAVKGTEAQWEEALQNATASERSGMDIATPSRVQIQTVHATSGVLKRKLDQKDIEQEAEANSKPSKKPSKLKSERHRSKGKKT